jgi:hypothetical protein
MSRLTNRPKANNQETSSTEKTTPKVQVTGTIKMINGVAVILPPEEAFEQLTNEEIETVIERNQDFVATHTGEEEVQYVYDNESEAKSQAQTAKVQKENNERAEKAKKDTTPKKVGDTIVINLDEDDDTTLFQQLEDERLNEN